MKKRTSLICNLASLLLATLFVAGSALFFAACSDDGAEEPEYPPLEEGSADLTNGYRIVMVDVNKLENFRLKLGTLRKLRLKLHDSSFPFELTEEMKDNVKYLILRLKDGTKAGMPDFSVPRSYKLTLGVEGDETVTKDLELVLRSSATSAEGDITYAKSIGKGTHIWADMGNTTYPILSFDMIRGQLLDNESSIQDGIKFECGGERFEETMEKMNVAVGITGQIGIKKKVGLSGGVTFSQETMTNTRQNFEYYLGYYGKNMAEVRINPDWITKVAGADRSNIYLLLDETVNDVFNNSGSDAYKVYSNDTVPEKGKKTIFDLLDHYGTHVISKASFGGNFIYMYAREENMYEHSIGHDAAANIQVKQLVGDQPATEWIEYYQRIHGSNYIRADASGGDYSYDYSQASKARYVIKSSGGNASQDVKSWDQSITADSRSTWIPISYTTKDDSGEALIPIYDLVKDSVRKNAIMKYFEAYDEKHTPKRTMPRAILADFMSVYGRNDHATGDPKSFVAQDDFGNQLIYYPLMANDNAPTDRGYALETSQSTYVSVNDNKDQYWYYALSYDDVHPGLTDVTISEDRPSGYSKRGDNADISKSGIIVNKNVYVKYATSDTPKDKLITGIGIYDRDADGHPIIASTGGTEWKRPFELPDNKKLFESYWTTEWRVDPSCEPWFKGATNHHPLKLCYTTKDLPENFKFGVTADNQPVNTPPISHPKKWGE